jgi:hypothetical protein
MNSRRAACVGVVEHGNSAVLVTLSPDTHEILDRRRIDLTHGLPTHPYHHEGSWAVGRYLDSGWSRPIELAEAVALVEHVHASAARGAQQHLATLAAALPESIDRIAIRACPVLPSTIEARIRDVRAANVADSVMYRNALAHAAAARGWSVHWYERERVFEQGAAALGMANLDAYLHSVGKVLGPPWQGRHKLATAAALAATLLA